MAKRLSCEEAFRRLDDYLDRELLPDEMAEVREHLQTCAHCAHGFAYESGTIKAIRAKIQRIEAPCDLLERVQAALDDVCREREPN